MATPSVRRLPVVNPSDTRFMRYFGATPDGVEPRLDAPWTSIGAISPLLVSAVIKVEDPRFFVHRGVDWIATRRQARDLIRTRRITGGGSTITQQLARNLYLTPSRSFVRKLREIVLALRIERRASKRRILELYLNLVEWGGGAWGCAAASAHYFGKAPRALDLFESTFLAALLPAPKAGLSGRHARRAQSAQLWGSYLMLLSGLTDPETCAVCGDRVRELHRLLAADVPLIEALASSATVTASADTMLLRAIVAELGVERVPFDAILDTNCGFRQQQIASRRLTERFGASAIGEVIATGSLAALRHPQGVP